MVQNKYRAQKSVLKKPAVLKKMLKYRKKAKAGEYALQLVELNYSNACNFSCKHCFSTYLSTDESKITLSDVKNLSQQADKLGVWQWHLQGGEPLVWDDLEAVVEAIQPSKFHIMITTNGYLLTEEKAIHLANIGIDKISVSLDSLVEEEHDEFRNKPGSYRKAIEALFNSQKAGLQTNINTVVTKQNVRSKGLLNILDFAQKHGFTLLFVIATSSGKWAGREDMLIDPDDAIYLKRLKSKYSLVHRDLYPLFDFEWGCRTMNGLVYITPNGELLSCPFIHISIGNILNEPLKKILERGWRVKYFRDYSEKCLAGEDRYFIRNFMAKTVDRKGPLAFKDAFNEDDLYVQ